VCKALGPAFDIMTDANQGFTVSEAIRRARHTKRSTSHGSRSRPGRI
jgi:L-alanine-DL-glutamate epimerase-like enolase superfamily enzyme